MRKRWKKKGRGIGEEIEKKRKERNKWNEGKGRRKVLDDSGDGIVD